VTPAVTETASDLDRVVAALRDGERFLLTTHEGPDGDALGSLLGLHHVLGQLGKDSVMFLTANQFPLPVEYRFMPLEEVFHEPPADLVDRTLVFLDCGNIDRMPVDFLRRDDGDIINVDHHHDNTRFGTVNLVDTDASCTAEIVYSIAQLVGTEITPEIASALYVGLITDTGRFMYENTGVASHRMAAELIEAGVDVHAIYRRIFEGVPQGKLELLARGLANVERFDDGLLTVTHLSSEDYAATGADASYSEGVVDHLRALEGTAVAGLIRDLPGNGEQRRKVSLRATDDRVDVSAIARSQGGGGHRRAAGFSTTMDYPQLVEVLRASLAEQL